MKNIAIVGAGPTGIYTLYALFKQGKPVSVTLYEKAAEAGVGMPFNDENNAEQMLANIASIEIPPIFITYLAWLRDQDESWLARYGIERDSLHDRQFLPRVMLGDYFRDRLLTLIEKARASGFSITVHESTEVTDVRVTQDGVQIRVNNQRDPATFDFAAIATGHLWPEDKRASRAYFPNPWSGLMDTRIPPCNVGIMGTSLSGLDAAMAVVTQHGAFITEEDDSIRFHLRRGSEALSITLMSRGGILPEADFYCPLPYEPLSVVTAERLDQTIALGAAGLLDRIFSLMVEEMTRAAPRWCAQIALETLNADTFADAWFADRKKHNPFHWAAFNLQEVERNKREKHTVAWRYTVLRLHEIVETVVPHLNEEDRKRFQKGLARVFIDNYAAIPSESIRRLLALREAGIMHILALGQEYEMTTEGTRTLLTTDKKQHVFDVFIDARGQKALKTKDLPFPGLREQLLACGDDIPDVGEDYTLQEPECVRGRIAFGALPWLMHDHPFVQGITVCAEIGAAMANAVFRQASGRRRRWRY